MPQKIVLSLIYFISVFHLSFSQTHSTNFLLAGTVFDSKTKEGIPYVNIYFRGSGEGTSSDQSGNYAIQMDASRHSDTLVFSAIGYKTITRLTSILAGANNTSIYLEEAVVGLQEVTVTADAAVDIIKQAMKNRPLNYGIEPHKLSGLYRITDRENGAFVRLAEAAVDIYDNNFMDRNSRATNYLAVRHSKDFRTFKWKMDNLNSRTVEELLKPDLIKRPNRATHPNGFERGFFYTFEKYAMLEGQEVYVIAATKNPAYQWPNYNAVFYVRVEDLAIVRIDRNYSISRPNWARSKNVSTKIISDQLILKYKDSDGKMYLNYFLWNLKGEVVDDISKSRVIGFERNEELNVHKVSFETKGKMRTAWDNDIYKMQEPYNKTFWENYAVSNTKLFMDVTKELSEKENLEQQFLSSDSRYSVYDPGKLYAPDELKEDFKLFRRSLEEGHPAIYRYTIKETLNHLFDSVYNLLLKPKTELEFYQLLTPLVAGIRCGHTRALLSTDHYKFNDHRAFYFPLQIQVAGGKLLIASDDPKMDSLKGGDEILSINGEPVEKLLETVYASLPVDGHVRTAREEIAERHFARLYNIHRGNKEQFFLTVRNGRGRISEKSVSGTSFDQVTAQQQDSSHANAYSIIKDGIALLKISTFADNNRHAFKTWIDKSFDDMAKNKVSNLIIDLRDNSGGRDDYALYAYSFIARDKFAYHKTLQSATSNFSFINFTDQDSSFNRTIGEIVQRDSSGRFLLRRSHPTLGIHERSIENFTGNVSFLINGNTFSAAADFASIARHYQRGIFIGEETGGAAIGNTSNGELTLTLPNTHIRILIPLFMITNAVNDDASGRGVIPEYTIDYTQKNVKDADAELQLALELVSATKK
jgi:C-terminal processing protease CtpA/Prc